MSSLALPVEWIGAPYRLGGRDLETGVDCLGVTLLVLDLLGVPAELHPDPWRRLASLWSAEGSAAALASTGFPPGWERLSEVPRAAPPDGMVGVVSLEASRCEHDGARTAGVGATLGGRFWTAKPATGVIAPEWRRSRPTIAEAWALA